MTDHPCQKDVEPFRQCCCECIHHRPVHWHCSTAPKRREPKVCVCCVQKGWACVTPAELGDRVYDNWPEHSCGCELHTKETDQ